MVLLLKGGKPLNEPFSYRPVCLLDNMGKLLERLIADRLTQHLEKQGGLSNRQYGFRKKRSIVDAIAEVVSYAGSVLGSRQKEKDFCAIITLDIRNAFNSVRREAFMDALQSKNVPNYLVSMVDSYLN